MSAEQQLALFDTIRADPRFRREIPVGPARLLRALVRIGLAEHALLDAAALVLALDAEPATEEGRP